MQTAFERPTQVLFWYNRFKEVPEEVNDNARPDRPNTLTTDENVEAVQLNDFG